MAPVEDLVISGIRIAGKHGGYLIVSWCWLHMIKFRLSGLLSTFWWKWLAFLLARFMSLVTAPALTSLEPLDWASENGTVLPKFYRESQVINHWKLKNYWDIWKYCTTSIENRSRSSQFHSRFECHWRPHWSNRCPTSGHYSHWWSHGHFTASWNGRFLCYWRQKSTKLSWRRRYKFNELLLCWSL